MLFGFRIRTKVVIQTIRFECHHIWSIDCSSVIFYENCILSIVFTLITFILALLTSKPPSFLCHMFQMMTVSYCYLFILILYTNECVQLSGVFPIIVLLAFCRKKYSLRPAILVSNLYERSHFFQNVCCHN